MSEPFDLPRSRRSPGAKIDRLSIDEHIVVVAVEGDLDLWSAPALKRTLSELLDSGPTRLVLDLNRVGFMDSTALGVMVAIHRRLSAQQRLAIAAAGPAVLRVFELSGIDTLLQVFPNRDEALSYVTEHDQRVAERSTQPLTSDAALLLGIASTAMPFAQSTEDQAERWLRALRNHGEAGGVLASLGLSEPAVATLDDDEHAPGASLGDADAVATVADRASRIAAERGAPKLTTTDILLAVIQVYGPTFYRVLAAHGVDPAELAARMTSSDPTPAEG